MHETPLKMEIQRGLSNFGNGELAENAAQLLTVLGYESQQIHFEREGYCSLQLYFTETVC